MYFEQVMQELEQAGSEQTARTYRRHGVQGPVFGVLTSALEKLRKKIKVDHGLALALWETGNHDARILAAKIADTNQATSEQLEVWVSALDNYVLSDALAAYVARTPLLANKAVAWSAMPDEWIAATGWQLIASLAMQEKNLTDTDFLPYLETIETEIHSRANRVRYSMNNALIAIGIRSSMLRERALAVAASIGKVYVDHGETNCKTPDATAYIAKVEARRAAA